jgi:hypothetical protein
MARFKVSIEETLRHTVTVEAEDKSSAALKAYEIVMNGPETGFSTESLGTDDEEYQITEIAEDPK